MKKEHTKKGKQFISNKKAGRKYQQKVARRWGGKSVGTIEGQDVEHDIFSCECKKMKELPSCFVHTQKTTDRNTKKVTTKEIGWWTQVTRNCPVGKIPVLLMHKTGDKLEDDLVTLRLGDFEKLMKIEPIKKVKTNVSKKCILP